MGTKDTGEKMLEDYNDVFADIVNVLVFNGQRIIKENELETSSLSNFYKHENKDHVMERDVGKYWKGHNIRISLFGLENQTSIDKNMPIRIMCYDGAAYRTQLDKKSQKDKYPVITLVLYMGWETKWTKPLKLSDCLKFDNRLKPLIETFIHDYEINVINVAWLPDEQIEMFTSDFKILAKQLRSLKLKKQPVMTDDEIIHAFEVLGLMKALTNDNTYENMQALTKPNTKAKEGANTMTSIYALTLKQTAEKATKEAEEKATKEIAFRMKESGISINDIAKITNRSINTLKKWFAEAPSSKTHSVIQSA